MMLRLFALAALMSLISLTSCGDGGGDDSSVNPPGGPGPGPGQGALTLLATDDPFVYEMVTAANVTIDRISIHTDPDEEDNGFLVLYDGPPKVVDLLSLHDGITDQLVHANLAIGTYRQIRIRVTAAALSLSNGDTFSTTAGNLHLTSQATSGFKVFVDPPIEVVEGASRSFLLDFDLTKTFLPIPADDPMNATSFHLQPVIHAADIAASGQITGDVKQFSQQGPLAPVEDATVYVMPAGIGSIDSAIAVTSTNAAGEFTQLGLPPGVYDVLAVKGTLSDLTTDVEVTVGVPATVHLLLQ
jgi:hypothetical protein